MNINWVDVKSRLPARSGDYLVAYTPFSVNKKLLMVDLVRWYKNPGSFRKAQYLDLTRQVRYWQPVPRAPRFKGTK